MRDVLQLMASVSAEFQATDADMVVVERELESLYMQTKKLMEAPGKQLLKFDSYKQALAAKGVELKTARFYSNLDLEEMRKDHLYLLLSHLKSRFPSMAIIAAMSKIFNVHSYPEKFDDLPGYGDELQIILDFFAADQDDPEEFKARATQRWGAS